MNWYVVARNDPRARELADRHYSRKKPGTIEFCPPGNNIVLIIPSLAGASALWVSHRAAPYAPIEKPRFDGFDCWDNPYFRNESGIKSSELILEALAITRWLWRDKMPQDGFHSFVDPAQVKGVKVRGKLVHGFVFMKAGFILHDNLTQAKKLLRWIYPLSALMGLVPLAPLNEQIAWQPALFPSVF